MNRGRTASNWVRRVGVAGATCGAIALAVSVTLTAVLLGTQPVSAHKEQHDTETLAVFQELFMEQVAVGDRLFHGDGDLAAEMNVNLSDTGMACAMCHPFAKDTNPHEFPKFQEQMSEFATLRDMTNWCIENPNQGERIDDDSAAMKALEAYQYWSHTGSVLNPGEH